MDLEKILLHKVGDAVTRFKMIREGDRVAVALSGGKDSLTMLEALLLLAKREGACCKTDPSRVASSTSV